MVPEVLAAGLDPPVRRARRRPQAHARARAARPRRHRVPAIHRRHDRRREGRDAAAPQHRRQPGAGAGVDPAVPRPNRREVIITPLPLYHIFSLTANCLVVHDARRRERADPESARHPRLRQGDGASTSSRRSPASTRCSTRSSTIPTSRKLDFSLAQDHAGRRHGGAGGGRAASGSRSPACR